MEKLSCIKWGITLRSGNLSHRTKNLANGSLLFHKISGIEKNMDKWGEGGGTEGRSITTLRRNFLVSQCRIIS